MAQRIPGKMKTGFVFDKKTGTMQPVAESVVVKTESNIGKRPPDFEKTKKVDLSVPETGTVTQEECVQFRAQSDYTIMQVTDERSGKPLMYIGGYALEIKFNMAELNSVVRVEQCLEGLKKMFRKFIVDQALAGSK